MLALVCAINPYISWHMCTGRAAENYCVPSLSAVLIAYMGETRCALVAKPFTEDKDTEDNFKLPYK
jgi:hypothetical protein